MFLFRAALSTALALMAAGCPGDNDDGYVAPPLDAEAAPVMGTTADFDQPAPTYTRVEAGARSAK